jgi:hypothetical protein
MFADAEAVGEELSRFDVDLPVVKIDCVVHGRVLRCEQRPWLPPPRSR